MLRAIKSNSRSGFSVVQLIVSSLVATIVVLVAARSFFGSRDSVNIFEARQQILDSSLRFESIMAAHFRDTISIDGFSKSKYSSIKGQSHRPKGAPVRDAILLVRDIAPERSLPLTLSFSGNLRTLSGQFVRENQNSKEPSTFDLLSQTAVADQLLYLVSLENRNLVTLARRVTVQNDTSDTVQFLAAARQIEIPQSEFNRSPTHLKAVRIDALFVDEEARLTRQPLKSDTFDPSFFVGAPELLIQGVQELKIDYQFSALKDDGVFIPSTFVPELPTDCEDRPCPTWNHVSEVRMQVKFKSPKPAVAKERSIDFGGFLSDSEGYLVYERLFSFRPGGRDHSGFNTSMAGNSLECDPEDRAGARCNWACTKVFTSDDKDSPKWKGYGQPRFKADNPEISNPLASDYCIASTNRVTKKFIPAETAPGHADCTEGETDPQKCHMPGWKPYGYLGYTDNEQADAAIRHFNACETWARFKNPKASLACTCTQPLSFYYRLGTDSDPVASQHYYLDEALLKQLIVSTNGQDRHRNCFYYRGCDQTAAMLKAHYESQTTVAPLTLWKDQCKCLTHNIDENGEIERPVHGQSIDWNALCNFKINEATQKLERTETCPSTYNKASDTYLLFDGDQGLSEAQAALCACLASTDQRLNRGQGVFEYPLSQSSDPNQYWIGGRSWIDFRGHTPLEDQQTFCKANVSCRDRPQTPEFDETQTFGSSTSLTTSFNAKRASDPSARTISEYACTRAGDVADALASGQPSLASCLEDSGSVSDSTVLPQFVSRKGYCSRRCGVPISDTSDVAGYVRQEITSMRYIITGTPPSQSLPAQCGGSESGGSVNSR